MHRYPKQEQGQMCQQNIETNMWCPKVSNHTLQIYHCSTTIQKHYQQCKLYVIINMLVLTNINHYLVLCTSCILLLSNSCPEPCLAPSAKQKLYKHPSEFLRKFVNNKVQEIQNIYIETTYSTYYHKNIEC